jgi:hypothetical protein
VGVVLILGAAPIGAAIGVSAGLVYLADAGFAAGGVITFMAGLINNAQGSDTFDSADPALDSVIQQADASGEILAPSDPTVSNDPSDPSNPTDPTGDGGDGGGDGGGD